MVIFHLRDFMSLYIDQKLIMFRRERESGPFYRHTCSTLYGQTRSGTITANRNETRVRIL